MRFFRYFLVVFSLFSFSVQAARFSVSEAQLNHYLETKFSKKAATERVGFPPLFELTYYLDSLKAEVGRTPEKKLAVASVVSGVLNLKGKTHQAKFDLKLDARPYFNSEQGALFLQDVHLKQWQIEPQKYQRELAQFMLFIQENLNRLLATMPVYTLNEEETKEALFKKFGKAILVEEGELIFEASLF